MDQLDRNAPSDAAQRPTDAQQAHKQPFSVHQLFMDQAASGTKPTAAADKNLPPLDMVDFKARAAELLKNVSTDGDNHYEQKDLARLIEDSKIKGEDAVVAATLYQVFHDSPADVVGSVDGSGKISYKKVSDNRNFGPAEFDRMAAPSAKNDQDYDSFRSLSDSHNFDMADKNHDGRLNLEELKANPAYAQLVDDVPTFKDSLGPDSAGLSRQDIAYGMQWAVDTHDFGRAAAVDHDIATKALAAAGNRILYASPAHPEKSIKVEDVNQGTTGDCYFEATLASVAKSQPKLISQAIKDNKDGTYTVTFKGDASHPVTVATPTDGELALYAAGSADGIWPAVMEKAFAQHEIQTSARALRGGTAQDAVEGGNIDGPLKLLTGHDSFYILPPGAAKSELPNPDFPIWGDAGRAAARIEEALDHKHIVGVNLYSKKDAANGMVAEHAYSVVGYEHRALGDTLILRDPRGDASPEASKNAIITADQLSTIPLEFTVEK